MQGRHVHVYICVRVCLSLPVCIFICELTTKNSCAAASQTSSEAEELCEEVTRAMKMHACKHMYYSRKLVKGCAKAQTLQAAE